VRSGRMPGIDPDALVESLSDQLREWLPRQPWSTGGEPAAVVPIELEALRRTWPLVVWAPLRVQAPGGDPVVEQVVLGLAMEQPPGVPDEAVVGKVPTPDGWAVAYDALWDPEALAALMAEVAPDLRVRKFSPPEGGTAVVADGRWELRLERPLREGPNPEVEVPLALGRAGCEAVAAPVAVWRRHAWDVAVVRPRRTGPDALSLARESAAEVLAARRPPADARSDLADGAEALGRSVAEVHAALAESFGSEPLEPDVLVDDLVGRLRRLRPETSTADLDLARIESTYRRLAHGTDLGARIRVHGALHLDRARRDRQGWFVDGFGGIDPGATDARRSSPLHDVAALLRDVSFVAREALAGALQQLRAGDGTPDPDEGDDDGPRPIDPPERELALLAEAWEERFTQSFLRGYTSLEAVHQLLPRERLSRDALLVVFEHDLAVHEVAR